MAKLANNASGNMFSRSAQANRQARNQRMDKADAFFNVDVKLAGGKSARVGGIPLMMSKELHELLIANKDNLDKLTFEIDINMVDTSELKLAFDAADEVDETTAQLSEHFQTA